MLCRNRRKGNIYLPGGHLEGEERAADALRREIREELGRPCSVGRFLGVVQHAFDEHDHRVVEINLVFELGLRGLRLAQPPASCEKKLEFVWHPLPSLARSGLEPQLLAKVVPAWLKTDNRISRWASTF